MRRIVSSIGIFSALLLNASIPVTDTKPIINTTPVTPDVVILAKNEVRYTQGWDQVTTDNTIEISAEDAQRLMKIAYAEGGNQGITGQLLIMEVVYNRMLSKDYPNTIAGVITQPGQFESYRNGMYEAAEPTAETHLALAELEKGKDLNKDIIAFETRANHKSLERYFRYSFTYLEHDFYVKK